MVKGRAHSLPGASAERLTSGLHHRMSSIPTQLLVYYGNKVYFTHWNTLNGYSVSCLAYFHLPLFLRTVPPRLKFLVGEEYPGKGMSSTFKRALGAVNPLKGVTLITDP